MNLVQTTWHHLQRVLPCPWQKKTAPQAPTAQRAASSPKLFGTARFPAINMAELDTFILEDDPDPLQALDRLLGNSPRYQVSAITPQTSLAQTRLPKEAGSKRSP
jgi:hypothetical protein